MLTAFAGVILFLTVTALIGGLWSLAIENHYQKVHYPLHRCGDKMERTAKNVIHIPSEDCAHCKSVKQLVNH